MASPTQLPLTILLILLGAGFGMLVWMLTGLGLVELGIMDQFDPVGVAEEPSTPSTATKVLEWSYPAFALAGAIVFPRFVRWLFRPSAEADANP